MRRGRFRQTGIHPQDVYLRYLTLERNGSAGKGTMGAHNDDALDLFCIMPQTMKESRPDLCSGPRRYLQANTRLSGISKTIINEGTAATTHRMLARSSMGVSQIQG